MLEDALGRVGHLYADRLDAALTAEGRIAVAQRMVEQSREMTDQRIDAYALLVRAQQLFVAEGELESAMSSVEAQGALYDIDPLGRKVELLRDQALRKARSNKSVSFCRLLESTSLEAMRIERFDAAESLTRHLYGAAKRLHDKYELERASKCLAEVRMTRQAQRRSQDAEKKLVSAPDDGASHLAVARYEGMIRGNWNRALSHLARSSDKELGRIARSDLAAPAIAAEQVALGHFWWQAGENRRELEQRGLRRRAVHWYRQALDQTEGVERKLLLKRIDSVDTAGRPYRLDLTFTSAKSIWKHLESDSSEAFEFRNDGAHLPRTAGTELGTRARFKGDFRLMLEIHLGRAGFSNTGNSTIQAFGITIPVTANDEWRQTNLQVHLERRDDQLIRIVNGKSREVRTIPEDLLYKPSPVRYWWRSRNVHLKRLVIDAEQAFAPGAEQ